MKSFLAVKSAYPRPNDEIFTQVQEGVIVVIKTICHPQLSSLPGKIETVATFEIYCKYGKSGLAFRLRNSWAQSSNQPPLRWIADMSVFETPEIVSINEKYLHYVCPDPEGCL